MHLVLLHQTTCLTTYYDQCNDWLYLEWEGELTLALVQEACDAIGTCILERPYARVLNNNEQVTGVSWDVAAWLATDFLPHLTLAGVERLAWVYAPSLRGQHIVYQLLRRLPGPLVAAFDSVVDAVAYLQRFQTKPQGRVPTRSPAQQAKLAQQVALVRQRMAAQQLSQA
ncbi:MAG: STAS/SEC14 domain-containing protein [Janthinobacterium lividum]